MGCQRLWHIFFNKPTPNTCSDKLNSPPPPTPKRVDKSLVQALPSASLARAITSGVFTRSLPVQALKTQKTKKLTKSISSSSDCSQ